MQIQIFFIVFFTASHVSQLVKKNPTVTIRHHEEVCIFLPDSLTQEPKNPPTSLEPDWLCMGPGDNSSGMEVHLLFHSE